MCEGTKTEPYYFSSFRLANVDVVGVGGDPVTVVQEAVKWKKKKRKEGRIYDQVWCVFDRDQISKGRFNEAIQKIESNRFKLAYSNEAFELWYLLHFEYLQSALSRDDYIKKLSYYLGNPYRKKDSQIINLLKGKEEDAIRNAERLLQRYSEYNPEANNPSTTVHRLVQELIKWK